MGLFDWITGNKSEVPAPEDLAPPPPTKDDIEAALHQADTMAREHNAPTPVLARVARVAAIVRALMPRVEHLGLQSADAYNVVATATDYLPESLAAYLTLPRDWANTRPVSGQKSSLLLLIDQLDLLTLTMSRMFDAANQRDASALVAQGKFLDEKFGGAGALSQTVLAPPEPSSNPLDLGASGSNSPDLGTASPNPLDLGA